MRRSPITFEGALHHGMHHGMNRGITGDEIFAMSDSKLIFIDVKTEIAKTFLLIGKNMFRPF